MPTIEHLQISHLYGGDWERAGLERPELSAGDRAALTARLYDRAGLWLLCDGRHLAVELGYRIGSADLRLCGGGATRGDLILFDRGLDLFERSLVCFHEIAHAELKREGWTSSEADAWLLTVDLAIPPEARRLLPIERVFTEAHVPHWFARIASHPTVYFEHDRTTLRPAG